MGKDQNGYQSMTVTRQQFEQNQIVARVFQKDLHPGSAFRFLAMIDDHPRRLAGADLHRFFLAFPRLWIMSLMICPEEGRTLFLEM